MPGFSASNSDTTTIVLENSDGDPKHESHTVLTTNNPIAGPPPSGAFNVNDEVEVVDNSGQMPVWNMAVIEAIYSTNLEYSF